MIIFIKQKDTVTGETWQKLESYIQTRVAERKTVEFGNDRQTGGGQRACFIKAFTWEKGSLFS